MPTDQWTPQSLSADLTPAMRDQVTAARRQLLAGLPVPKRIMATSLWTVLMALLPSLLQIAISLMAGKLAPLPAAEQTLRLTQLRATPPTIEP